MPSSQLGVGMLGDFMLGLAVEAPGPLVRTVPLIERVPNLERRLGRVTDLVSAVFNSLTRSAQLIQTAPGEYRIVLAPDALKLVPGAEPDASPYFGQLWADADGNLHYLGTDGIDYQLTPPETSTSSSTLPIVNRVLDNDSLTIPDGYCLVVADYFTLGANGVLTLAGDGTLEVS